MKDLVCGIHAVDPAGHRVQHVDAQQPTVTSVRGRIVERDAAGSAVVDLGAVVDDGIEVRA